MNTVVKKDLIRIWFKYAKRRKNSPDHTLKIRSSCEITIYMMEKILRSAKTHLESTPNAGHDITHTLRVRDLCLHISSIEGGDPEILEASALLHDIGRPAELKDPGIDHASLSAQLAPGILDRAGFPAQKIPAVVYAIANHRYSSGITPGSLEARILQDADRLDISGAVGAAMTFAYSGAYNHRLYHPGDPLASQREPDGKEYALDHILTKLMLLPGSMHTGTAKGMVEEKNKFLQTFVNHFIYEINTSRWRANE